MFRFSFNVCQNIVQEPMILPVFLTGGVEEPQLRYISYISYGFLDDGFILGWETLTLAYLRVS